MKENSEEKKMAPEEQYSALVRSRKAMAGRFTRPVIRILARMPIAPDAVTWAGFLLTLVAAGLVGSGFLFAGGWVVLFAALFDMLDGALARSTNRVTRFGAVLDSTLDRLSEAVLLIGILIYYLIGGGDSNLMVLLAALALMASPLVSYVRARAEAIGVDCQDGFFTRAERVIALALGLLLSRFDYVLGAALALIAFFSLITTFQRLIYVWQRTRTR